MNPDSLDRYKTTGHQILIYMATDNTVVNRGFVALFEESKILLFVCFLGGITYCWLHGTIIIHHRLIAVIIIIIFTFLLKTIRV